MRITYLLPVYWPAIGGCELHTHELVRRLSERHQINVITLINNQEDKLARELWMACILRAPGSPVEYADNKAKVTRLSLTNLEKYINYPLARVQSPKLPPSLVKMAMERLSNFYKKKLLNMVRGTDLLHCVHGGVSYLGYASLKAARILGIPFVFTPVLHLYHKDWLDEIKDCRANNRPFIYNPQLWLEPRGWTDPFWYELTTEADLLISMTAFEKDFFVKRGIPAEKIHNVGVGPLLAKGPVSDFRKEHRLENKKIVLFLGRNVEAKGVVELLMASDFVWDRYPDTIFIFAGPIEDCTGEIFSRHKDPRIKVLDYVTDAEKAALLNACDIFCMPSFQESLGGTFLEAWSFGKPIIGARIPPLIELTNNGEGGLLVEPDPQDIAEKIMILLKDPELGKRMGLWGKRKVDEQYSWEVITEKMEDIYRKTIK